MTVKLPQCLIEPMRVYRETEAPLPKQYEHFHRLVSRIDITLHENTGEWIVIENLGAEGRDIRGMAVNQVIAAIKDTSEIGWTVHKLEWHTSGAWFSGNLRFLGMQADANERALMSMPLKWTEAEILAQMLAAA